MKRQTYLVNIKSQIIFRYVINSKIAGRFIRFFVVSKDKSASDLSDILLNKIKTWDISYKLVCQTYDGASVIAGQNRDGQAIIKETYPKAMFIHCYANLNLNLVFLLESKVIKSVRMFIGDLTHFFFSHIF
jgi:hypothetical protein